ncbi:MAG TPA: copper chaperone, partial [Anaerolineae bacterium]|nr:copper chaperone [Anaerolineae bacterium]
NTIILRIPNISCDHCIHTIKRELGSVEGVGFVSGDVAARQVTVNYENDDALARAKATLAEIGYPISV